MMRSRNAIKRPHHDEKYFHRKSFSERKYVVECIHFLILAVCSESMTKFCNIAFTRLAALLEPLVFCRLDSRDGVEGKNPLFDSI